MNKDKWIQFDKAITALYKLEEYRSAEWGAKRFTTDDIETMLEVLAEDDVTPIRHGYWTLFGEHLGIKMYQCSICKGLEHGKQNYCPNCGARMDGDKND